MCGIAGIFASNRECDIDHDTLAAMVKMLAHRGPDDTGYFAADGAGLGFSRLSIIDLSSGNQPHFNEDQSIVSICNGEIYNYKELRSQLESKGHVFRTRCDVEALPHLYEEEGTDFLRRLNGQFAFAIFDRKRRELLLARDHFGVAPLFYAQADGMLLFASEIKALLTHSSIKHKVNPTALDQIFTFPGLVSPATMFNGIYSLKSGHYLRVKESGIETREYWDLVYPEEQDIEPPREESYYIRRLDELFNQAVLYRLNADVPVGFYLSGGLDSSLVASVIHAARPNERRHSFSVLFSQAEIDERRYQRLMSEYVGSIHHETEFDWPQIGERLRSAIYHAECPLKESYDACSLALSELVRRAGLKVVLTGEGSDELFAGYVGYRLDQTRSSDMDDPFDVETMLENERREELWGDSHFFYERDFLAFRETKSAIYSEALAARMEDFESIHHPLVDKEKLRNRHPMHKRSYLDFKLRIADHLVADHGDRPAYANSVEARYPFLDVDLVEFVKTIPPSMMIKDATEKYILRAMAKNYLPTPILNREKFGFVAPGSPYLLQRNIDWVNDLLSTETIKRQGYFNPAAVERLKARYSAEGASVNTTFETDFLMIILTFGIFLETFDMPSYS
ncbi:MAG: asparagine synthase (glutamine-hydrolyzing) [Candidatus Omnitrophota bacterium]